MITVYTMTQYQTYSDPDGLVNDCKLWRDLLAAGQITYSGETCADATDDAPAPLLDPNVMVARLTIEQAAFDWILASPDYGEGSILYDLPNPYKGEDKPDNNAYGKMRSYAAKLGISNTQFRALFGLQGNPKNRKEGADNLIGWIRTLPKGQAKK